MEEPESQAAPIGGKHKPRPRVLIMAVLLSFVFSLLIGELLLRVYVAARGWTANCYAASLFMLKPHPELGYELAADFHLKTAVFEISTNSQGLRGPTLQAKSPERTRIAVMGGSSAFGYLVSDGQEAARILERQLTSEGCNVEVLNGGVPGYNLNQTIPRFRNVIAPLKPKVVLLYLGWNDLTYVVSDNPEAKQFTVRPVAPAWERLFGRSVLYGFVAYRLLGAQPTFAPASFDHTEPTAAGEAAFKQKLRFLISEIRKSGATAVICSQASAAHPQADRSLLASLSPDVDLQSRTIRLGQWLHDAVATVAREENTPFIDAYESIPPTGQMLGDYIHLTKEGEAALADLWAGNLLPMVR